MTAVSEIDSASVENVSAEEASAALSQLLATPNLGVSERNKRFLQYVVQETLAGRADRIKSFTIAVDVFGRGSEFDGSADSIVRTEATRLRGALTRYYATTGADDPIKIVLAPGSYAPRFERKPTPDAVAVAVEDGTNPTPTPARKAPFAEASATARKHPIAALAIAAVLIIVAALVAAQVFQQWPSASVSTPPTIVVAMTQPIGEAPNLGGLATGFAQSLTQALIRYNGLSIALATEKRPPDAIMARLSGRGSTFYLLESSIENSGSNLRFRWRLVEAADRTVLWSDQRDEPFNGSSALDVEDQVADGVARILGVRGGIVTLTEQDRHGVHTTDGYACVLRGIAYTGTLSASLHAEARDCLERTVAEDPNYAEALALLSYIYADEDRSGLNPRGSKEDILARALAASDRAVALAPMSSLVQQMRSTVFFQMGNYPSFEAAARQAIALNPGNPPRLIVFGNRLFTMGRYEEGAALVRKGLAMEPFPSAVEHVFSLLDEYRLGDYRTAAAEAAKLDPAPDYYFLPVVIAAIDGELGDPTGASANIEKLLKLRPDYAKTFRADWRNRRFQDDFIDKIADGLRKAGLQVE